MIERKPIPAYWNGFFNPRVAVLINAAGIPENGLHKKLAKKY
jgi:hypothetical protein